MKTDARMQENAIVELGWKPSRTSLASAGMVRRVLLACGILSSLLYAITDVLGGLRYPGYSFTSQAVSELMAVGAPSESFVDPLFLAGAVLMMAFAVGTIREGTGQSRALRTTGALLLAYAVIGLTGPTLFEMHRRGTGDLASDTPHIVLTAALVLLLLLAIGIGAFAFGRRFRVYSFATLATVIVLGVLSGPFAAKLAAGEPTPGFGILERILIYSSLSWIAVLAAGLLRRPAPNGTGRSRDSDLRAS